MEIKDTRKIEISAGELVDLLRQELIILLKKKGWIESNHIIKDISFSTHRGNKFVITLEVEVVTPSKTLTPEQEHFLDQPIEEFDISVRLFNVLENNGIKNFRILLSMTKKEVMSMKNMGKKLQSELEDLFATQGLIIK